MGEETFTLDDGCFFKAITSDDKKNVYIYTNTKSICILTNFIRSSQKNKNSLWRVDFELRPKFEFATRPYFFDQVYIDLQKHEEKTYHRIYDNYGIKKLSVRTFNTNESEIEYTKFINANSPYKVEASSIMGSDGQNVVEKEIHDIKNAKNPFYNYRFSFFGRGGEDSLNIMTYGLNDLSGGAGDDEYTINIMNEYDPLYTHRKKKLKSYKDYIIELWQGSGSKKKKNKIVKYPGITFISDYGRENNKIEISIESPNMSDTVLLQHCKFSIAYSSDLPQELALKLSPDPFLIIKNAHNYVFLHPQIASKIVFDFRQSTYNFKSCSSRNFIFTTQEGKKSYRQSLSKLYGFNLSQIKDYKSFYAKLNAISFKNMDSFESIKTRDGYYDKFFNEYIPEKRDYFLGSFDR